MARLIPACGNGRVPHISIFRCGFAGCQPSAFLSSPHTRQHLPPQNRIQPRLIPLTPGLQPIQHIGIHLRRNLLLVRTVELPANSILPLRNLRCISRCPAWSPAPSASRGQLGQSLHRVTHHRLRLSCFHNVVCPSWSPVSPRCRPLNTPLTIKASPPTPGPALGFVVSAL
jgi:hypothetical protein